MVMISMPLRLPSTQDMVDCDNNRTPVKCKVSDNLFFVGSIGNMEKIKQGQNN